MKDWWTNSSLREKQILALGVLLLAMGLIYEGIFATLADANENLRHQIHKNQALLAWMQEGDQRIKALQHAYVPQTTTAASASLLSRIQNDLTTTAFQKNVSQLQQADNNSVEMHLQQVSFDSLSAWLIKLCRAQQLTITDLFIKPGTAEGMVDATIKLKQE